MKIQLKTLQKTSLNHYLAVHLDIQISETKKNQNNQNHSARFGMPPTKPRTVCVSSFNPRANTGKSAQKFLSSRRRRLRS